VTSHTGKEDAIVEIFLDASPKREEFERNLIVRGTNLPLPHRTPWARAGTKKPPWFVGVRAANGTPIWGFGLEVAGSRALPGYLLLRAERLSAPTKQVMEVGLSAILAHAKVRGKVLRISLELFSRDAGSLRCMSEVAAALGCRKEPRPRMYTHTIAIDLQLDESEIFSKLHGTARRHIRAIDKHALSLQTITSADYAERMGELIGETMTRTGGNNLRYDWRTIIELSNEYPDLSRIAGVCRTDITGPRCLLAFAWGRHHGDHVDYAVAASTRATDIRAPVGYAPAWDLIRWAKANGATWFDFGGITLSGSGSDDPLAGISDFKRYFGGDTTPVSEEWVFEPGALRAKLARTIGAGAFLARKFLRSST
jgi:hypothetical protein